MKNVKWRKYERKLLAFYKGVPLVIEGIGENRYTLKVGNVLLTECFNNTKVAKKRVFEYLNDPWLLIDDMTKG